MNLRWTLNEVELKIVPPTPKNSLLTDVVISLFTDRRAIESDSLPSGDTDRRGWWGDSFNQQKIGSRLWLLSREKRLPSVVTRAQQYAEEALQWLNLDNRISDFSIQASAVQNALSIKIIIYLDGKIETLEFKTVLNWI